MTRGFSVEPKGDFRSYAAATAAELIPRAIAPIDWPISSSAVSPWDAPAAGATRSGRSNPWMSRAGCVAGSPAYSAGEPGRSLRSYAGGPGDANVSGTRNFEVVSPTQMPRCWTASTLYPPLFQPLPAAVPIGGAGEHPSPMLAYATLLSIVDPVQVCGGLAQSLRTESPVAWKELKRTVFPVTMQPSLWQENVRGPPESK